MKKRLTFFICLFSLLVYSQEVQKYYQEILDVSRAHFDEPEKLQNILGKYDREIRESEIDKKDKENIRSSLYFFLGRTYVQLYQYEEAVEIVTKAIELNPENYLAYNLRGNIYNMFSHDSDLINKAIQDYTVVLEHFPDSENYIDVYLKRGKLYKKRNQKKEAVKDVERVISLSTEKDTYMKQEAERLLEALNNK